MEPVRPSALELALDALVSSYDAPYTINNLDTCALPNRRAVITAFEHLQHVVALGFFADRQLNRGNCASPSASTCSPRPRA